MTIGSGPHVELTDMIMGAMIPPIWPHIADTPIPVFLKKKFVFDILEVIIIFQLLFWVLIGCCHCSDVIDGIVIANPKLQTTGQICFWKRYGSANLAIMISPDNSWKYFCSNKEHNGIGGSDSKFTRQTQPRVECSPTYVNTKIWPIHRGSL